MSSNAGNVWSKGYDNTAREAPAPALTAWNAAVRTPSPRPNAWSGVRTLNPRYTFDTFVEGECNRLPRSAAYAIAERPGQTSFNPFLIYGGVGLGKTHLAQAIGNEILRRGTTHRVVYISSEQFTGDYIHAIKNNRVGDFTTLYRAADVLIVDDIQFLSGKEKTQEAFFHVFNDLHQRGKQVVLCADRPPRDIKGIEERLLSRFQWGLSADVRPPDLNMRQAILRQKAELSGLDLAAEVIEFVAQQITSNVRALEGAVARLLVRTQLLRRPLNLNDTRETLQGLINETPLHLDVDEIQRVVARHYDLTVEALLARTRKQEVAQARQVAMYLAKRHTTHTLERIGVRFGGRDHSTVVHACATIEGRMSVDPSFRTSVERIERTLGRAAA